MPYSPGVENISGQILAQSRLASAQQYGQAMQGISAGLQQFQQNEILRRQATGTAVGKIASNPFLQSQLSQNQDMSDLFDKVSSGNAKMKDVQQLAGWASGAEDAQKQQMAQAQMQQVQQQNAAQQFAQQQAQLAAQQKAAAIARVQQYAGLLPGSGTGPWSSMPQGTPPPAPDPSMQQAASVYSATGQLPDANTMTTDSARQAIANTRAGYEKQITDMRDQTRAQIAAATDATNQAKLDAKGQVTFHTDPNTGITVAVGNGQIVPLPGQVSKDPLFDQIDKMEANKDLTHAQAVNARQNLIYHKSTFAPNPLATLMNQAQTQGGAPAPAAAGAAPVTMDQFYNGTGKGGTNYSSPTDLIAAVRAGTISASDAKALAAQNGWQ